MVDEIFLSKMWGAEGLVTMQNSQDRKTRIKRPSLPAEILGRLRHFFRAKWSRLGYDEPIRRFRVVVYGIGLVATTYSLLHIFYELNIDLSRVLQLPFHEFYREQ